ncbi:MAG: methyltransferase domain-containing protein [Acidobacteriota bacterium]
MTAAALDAWLAALEARHLADLRFSEVTRALRALSSAYVERRDAGAARRSLDGAGKRAAFALYYAPRHYLTVRHILERLPGSTGGVAFVVDLGCGTGVAGAAWAGLAGQGTRVLGLDHHPWTLGEAAFTYRALGVPGDVRRADLARVGLPRGADAVVAAFTLNEVAPTVREAWLERLLAAGTSGARVLVVEPIATRVVPWWAAWASRFAAAGGRADEWRIDEPLPPLVRRLAKAAGLRADALNARSLSL